MSSRVGVVSIMKLDPFIVLAVIAAGALSDRI
jgi:hypothetical protein